MVGVGIIGMDPIGDGDGILGTVPTGDGDGILGTVPIGDGDGTIGMETVFMAQDGVAITTIGVGAFMAVEM
jgi:hypothetical protein